MNLPRENQIHWMTKDCHHLHFCKLNFIYDVQISYYKLEGMKQIDNYITQFYSFVKIGTTLAFFIGDWWLVDWCNIGDFRMKPPFEYVHWFLIDFWKTILSRQVVQNWSFIKYSKYEVFSRTNRSFFYIKIIKIIICFWYLIQ